MSLNKTRGRHRAQTASRARTIGSTAAVVAAGSGLMLGLAAPASAGVVSNDSYAAPVAAATPVATPVEAPVAAAVAAPAVTEAGGTHTVQSGDTLSQIAATYGVSLDEILSLNGLSMDSIIYPGDVISYAGTGAVAATAAAAATPVAVVETPVAAVETPVAAAAAPAAVDLSSISVQASSVTPVATADVATSSTGQIMLNSAYSQLGATQDCTILVEVALRAAGFSVGDLAPAQLAAYGTQVSDPQPGDIIYYADGGMGFAHIAIYVGDGQAIHSGWNGNQTVQQSANVGSGAVYYRVA